VGSAHHLLDLHLLINHPMVITSPRLSLDEYLNYRDDGDIRYELVQGELIEMPPATGKHADIIDSLNDVFKSEIKRLGHKWVSRHSSIAVSIPQLENRATVRIPDITIVTQEQWQRLSTRSAVLIDETPLLVVEVVSEGTQAIDHRRKRAEYNILEVPEYWLIDFLPDSPKYPIGVTILNLIDGLYESTFFLGDTPIVSQIFPELHLTPEQILNPE
jgi:Uma2 family endonuclease